MNKNIELLYEYTSDDLRLQGVHYNSEEKNVCVVCIHGQGENIIENYFAHVWGESLQKNNIGFLYGHNRGHSHINDISTKDGNLKRVGAAFEIFEESIYDVELWINKAKELGYKKIILLGHSLGCNKAIYYLYKKGNVVDGLVLASPPDMVGLTKLEEPNYNELVKEAKINIENSNPKKLLNELLGGYSYVSSESFLNFYIEGNNIDNLPIERNPERFEQLENINIPVLIFAGEKESRTYLKIELLKEKFINNKNIEIEFIKNSGHTYKNCEMQVITLINEWINKNI